MNHFDSDYISMIFQRSKRTGTKRAGKAFLSMANSYSKQKLSETDESSPTTYCLNGNGYSKPLMGSIEVSRVDGVDDNDYYYLSIQGMPGHHLTAILEVLALTLTTLADL
jgi:hypothetical protein